MAALSLRNRLIGAVHAAKKATDLDDETYRAMLTRVTGKASAKDLTTPELYRVLDHLNGGKDRHHFPPPKTTSPTAKKARALWISLHALGAISDPSEKALRAWVKRQHHVDDLAFVRPAQSFAVIEGLKQWCVRLGVDWTAHADPRRCVIDRQIAMLTETGAEFRANWLASIENMDAIGLDDFIVRLGGRVRGEHD